MHKVALVTLRGYREWTEGLGPRREHLIQEVQAEIHRAAWRAFTGAGALPHHFRYDFVVVYANNVPDEEIYRATRELAAVSPVPVEACIGRGPTPYHAYADCRAGGGGAGEGPAVVAHMDLAHSTLHTASNGPYSVYRLMMELTARLGRLCESVGCMPFYLGGDNVAIFLPHVEAAEGLLKAVEGPVRMGVGVSERPYEAMVKATEGLDSLRARGRLGLWVVR